LPGEIEVELSEAEVAKHKDIIAEMEGSVTSTGNVVVEKPKAKTVKKVK
jgi:hypothetical protein